MKKHALPLSVSFPPPKKISAMESIVFLKERGLDAIDFAITNIIEERDDWRDDVPLIKAALEMTGLIAVSGHLPFRASDTMPLHDKILRGIEFAGEMGLKRAVMHPIGNRKADNTDESRKYWFEKILQYLYSLRQGGGTDAGHREYARPASRRGQASLCLLRR